MDKVYCKDCKYRMYENRGAECKLSGVEEYNFYRSWVSYNSCRERNSENDCKDFAPRTFWLKIWDGITA